MAEGRRVTLWIAVAVTLAAAVLVARMEVEEAAPADRARSGARRDGAAPGAERAPVAPRAGAPLAEAGAGAIDLERLRRPPMDVAAIERIAGAWEPPPPPAPPPPRKAAANVPAAPPQPPPLPFRAIGGLVDGEVRMAFVQAGQVVHVLKAGDRVQQNYRVDNVTEQQVTFTYLPLNARQVLAMGATQ